MLSAPLQLREICAQVLAKDWVAFVSISFLDIVINVWQVHLLWKFISLYTVHICARVPLFILIKDLQINLQIYRYQAVFLIMNH